MLEHPIIILFSTSLVASSQTQKGQRFLCRWIGWELHSSINKKPEKQGLFLSHMPAEDNPGGPHLPPLSSITTLRVWGVPCFLVQPILMRACHLIISYFTSNIVGLHWQRKWEEEKKAGLVSWSGLALKRDFSGTPPNNLLVDVIGQLCYLAPLTCTVAAPRAGRAPAVSVSLRGCCQDEGEGMCAPSLGLQEALKNWELLLC